MKKILILIMALFLTGCTVVRIDTKSIDNTINVILSKNNTLYNRVGNGYKYYVPRGVTYIDTDQFNEKLYSNSNYYYLYINAIGYYYQSEIIYEPVNNAFYQSELDFNGKKGYIIITKKNGKYLIEFMYNYAKIEALVAKEDINDVVMNSSYILSTVKFNHNVIKIMLDEDYFINQEKQYNVFESDKPVNNYLEEINS